MPRLRHSVPQHLGHHQHRHFTDQDTEGTVGAACAHKAGKGAKGSHQGSSATHQTSLSACDNFLHRKLFPPNTPHPPPSPVKESISIHLEKIALKTVNIRFAKMETGVLSEEWAQETKIRVKILTLPFWGNWQLTSHSARPVPTPENSRRQWWQPGREETPFLSFTEGR